MNKALFAALLVASVVMLSAAHGQTYQWKDSSGKTVISDSPPPGSAKASRSIGAKLPAVVTGSAETESEKGKTDKAAASAPQTIAEKELEFRKRQQESREKAEKEEKEAAAAREKRDTCERARNNYRLLQSDTPLSQPNGQGRLQTMDAAKRSQELERTRRIMQEACK